jgi:RNA polymerase sigma-70 factor (ECF subfamily)
MPNTERDLMQQRLEAQVRAACDGRDYQAAVTALLEQIGPKVLAFLLQRSGNAADASETFSMFSEDLWRGLPGFEWRCTVRGWSFALARHAADRQRKQGWERRCKLPLSEAPLSNLVAAVRERTLPYLRSEVKGGMQQLFKQLSADDQALLQLRIDQRLGWRELALALDYAGSVPSDEELQRSAAKLRKRYQSLKQRLRQLAEESGIIGEES